jgi:hypothetical protein
MCLIKHHIALATAQLHGPASFLARKRSIDTHLIRKLGLSAEPLNMAKREIQNSDHPGRSQSRFIPSRRYLSEMETVDLFVAHRSVVG